MDYQPTTDGFMFMGHLAPTFESNLRGGTYCSVYLIVNEKEGCLIDTSITAHHAEKIYRMIEDSGCEVKYIVLTHDHFDHVANAGAIKERFGGKIMAHRLDVPMIENPLFLFSESATNTFPEWSRPDFLNAMNMSVETWESYHNTIETFICFPQRVDETVEDGQELALGNLRLRIIHTPGHSPGSISIFKPDTKNIYTGDLNLFPKRPYPIGNIKATEESLLKVKSLGASFLGIGHETPPQGVAEVRNYLVKRVKGLFDEEMCVLEALRVKGPLTVEEVTDIVFPDTGRHREYPNPDLGIYCHLLRLSHEEITKTIFEDGKFYWRLSD